MSSKTRVIYGLGGRIVAFSHETDEQAKARYERMEAHRNDTFQYTDPNVRAVYQHIANRRRQLDDWNTVFVSSGKHVVADDVASALVRTLIPTQCPPGTYRQRLRERTALRIKVAATLGIPVAEVGDVIAQLRRNRTRRMF